MKVSPRGVGLLVGEGYNWADVSILPATRGGGQERKTEHPWGKRERERERERETAASLGQEKGEHPNRKSELDVLGVTPRTDDVM